MQNSIARRLCGEGSGNVCPFLKVSYDDAFLSENSTPFLCRKGTVFVSEIGQADRDHNGFCSGPPNYLPVEMLARPHT